MRKWPIENPIYTAKTSNVLNLIRKYQLLDKMWEKDTQAKSE